ncbi:MAG: hypothetical protein PHO48_04615 [Candidatus Gracilibacteria bacterium]|nr:hypothetical protein [Candidatus Gracilibacteria bacterium]
MKAQIEIIGSGTGDFTPAITNFIEGNAIHFVLAFSGGADDSSPLLKHLSGMLSAEGAFDASTRDRFTALLKESKDGFVADIIRGILGPLRGYRIAVQCGGTIWGVPKIAAQVAKEMGFHTIGVFPLVAKTKGYALGEDLLDLSVCVHPMIDKSNWGDETPVYCKLPNATIVIGGGAGTMVEISHLLKMNEAKGVAIRHIVPIFGTGGTADKVSFFPGKPDVMAKCIPHHPVQTGEEVLHYLRTHTNIDDSFVD